eukprot:TRINITY_DN9386_c1_g3_i1.p1 TRINITY_DN9386_c1_g3~~TRINITY_DN9386_c1_g3_i1.p1  ORF type:complete len:888 (-),score=83.68 TRINITY_DN9386_c1_g3_i1:67-2547(-)
MSYTSIVRSLFVVGVWMALVNLWFTTLPSVPKGFSEQKVGRLIHLNVFQWRKSRTRAMFSYLLQVVLPPLLIFLIGKAILFSDEEECSSVQDISHPSVNAGGAEDIIGKLVGFAKWPLAGGKKNPPDDMSDTSRHLASFSACCLSIFCAGLAFVISWGASLSSLPKGTRERNCGGATHVKALTSVFLWRTTHKRAMLSNVLRIALPLLSISLIMRVKAFIACFFVEDDDRDIFDEDVHTASLKFKLKMLGIDLEESIVDIAFGVAMFSGIMYTHSCFTTHIVKDLEVGLRHLLHVSGVSRCAYMFTTFLTEGLIWNIAFVFIFVITSLIESVRVVTWSSMFLILFSAVILAVSVSTTAYLVALVFQSSHSSNLVSKIVQTILMMVGPFMPLMPHMPIVGHTSKIRVASPIISANRALAELPAACVRNGCLLLSDIRTSFSQKTWVYPHDLVIGSSKAHILNPADAYVSFMLFACLQLGLIWIILILLDRRRIPDLHLSSERSIGESCLEIKDLKHAYGWTGSGKATLHGVSFAISRGDMLGLLGPNGAGKTTTIRCITGEERPTAGTISIHAADVNRAQLGLCPQETVLLQGVTVAENLRFFAIARGIGAAADADECVNTILKATCLEDKRDWFPDTLSGGMRRRLAVGCAMVAAPAIVVLDEPTTGLDPVSRRGIWKTILDMKASGSLFLLTTHMLDEAETLCSKLVILKQGRITAEGTVQEFKQTWGTGYALNVDTEDGQVKSAAQFMADLLPGPSKFPIRQTPQGLTYKVDCDDEALGLLVLAISKGKVAAGIKRWGVSQASLEDAYLRVIQESHSGVHLDLT